MRETSGVAPIALRLAIGREGIGLELEASAHLACVSVEEMTATLPGMRFPVDVSGGVRRFRHRRGQLQALRLAVNARVAERWLAPRLRGLVGKRQPDVWIEVGHLRATVCVSSVPEAGDADDSAPAMAFDVHVLPDGEDLRLVVANARGVGLPATPTAAAMACVGAALGDLAIRTGTVFSIRRPAEVVTRALLPEVGARAPSADGVRWGAISTDGDTWVLSATLGATPAAPTVDALRAREIAEVLREADDALLRGDIAVARSGYLDATERAPRHGDIARRIADVDARDPGRAEAALAALGEAGERDAAAGISTARAAGITQAELLVRVGDPDGALACLDRAADSEPAPVLAARIFEFAARLTRDPEDRARWLDRALARSPRITTARWARVEARLALGRIEDALADVEVLEALARSGAGKHSVWVRAGGVWRAGGLAGRSGAIFERALRFEPDDPDAMMGLGAALVQVGGGHEIRGVALLARALQIAESSRDALVWPIALELSKALADRLDDLPAAIAHAATIPQTAPEGPAARGLEGRWRAQLGDLAGAALCFARLRDVAASLAPIADDAKAQTIAEFLVEAAALERDARGDPLAAQRHLAVALRLRPREAAIRRAYREVGALLLRREAPVEPDRPEGDLEPDVERPDEPRPGPFSDGMTPGDEVSEIDVRRAARADELARRLQGDPTDDVIADELMTLLEELNRGHELVALLSARLEDASPERRAVLAPRAREALERLAHAADGSGRGEHAALYRDALVGFGLAGGKGQGS